MEKGNISVNTENIFPVIKKWLYSDQDIFIRELVSNCADAISKHKSLVQSGDAEATDEKPKIRVILNKTDRTLAFDDNGIGMTAEEVKKYINQVAFSGAEEFLRKYENSDEKNTIIGHFGLGFYSAFMVSEQVTIDTLSYQKGATPVHWVCDGSTEYEMTEGTRDEMGTRVTLTIAEDANEFLEADNIRATLDKYCGFLPYEIYFEDGETDEPRPLNDTEPLWNKKPSECTRDEYLSFYHKLFVDLSDPLFWIHLNVEYPFRLKGILYFPKLKHQFESSEGQIKLYNNQVFVADNIREVIPEFLLLLKGVIDCPDLPLNVSRSFLQNDGTVRRMSSHITKKVADRLTGLYNNEREQFEEYWEDIAPFVKYGCMRDEKFLEKVENILLVKTVKGEYTTFVSATEDKEKIFYASDEKGQATYLEQFEKQGKEALILDSFIDPHFLSFWEMKHPKTRFARIDSELAEDAATAENEELKAWFTEAINDEKIQVSLQELSDPELPAIVLLSEQSRRMLEMGISFGMADAAEKFPEQLTLVVNTKNEIVGKITAENHDTYCHQIFDLAMLAHRPLSSEKMGAFLKRSYEILNGNA
ncbi:MAG: molecular chaperone HtpG [Clostridia bacterium]|nr:molecular chaperone HtpG [Clostridia bacterium]